MDDAVRSSKMLEHYATVQEAERLAAGVGELERVRTQDVREAVCRGVFT